MSETLKRKTATGLFWGAMNNGTTQLLNVVIGIFLGRLLSPEEYGIVGVLTIFTVMAGNLQSSGFTQGLINMQTPTSRDYNSVFWFNVAVSVLLYALLFACAPLIAVFFDEPRLVSVSRLVFLSFLISSLGIAHGAYMLKNMLNRQIAISGFVALLSSGTVGIVMALRGWSYWSLAWQQIVYISVLNLCRYFYVGWRPSLKIDTEPVRRMFPFCSRLLVTNIVNTLSQHVLTIVFGRLLPMQQVGNYTQANKWNTQAHSFVSGTIGQVAQPVLVSVKGDHDREKRVFRKMMRFCAFLSFPCMLGLAMVSREFILLTIGDAWMGSIPLLSILCVAGAVLPMYTLYQNLAMSSGRSDIYMWVNCVQIAIQVVLILLCARRGITVMVSVYTLFIIMWLFVWQHFAHRLVGVTLFETLCDTLPFLLITLLSLVCAWFATQWIRSLWQVLLARVVITAAVYVVLMQLFLPEMVNECKDFVRKKQ